MNFASVSESDGTGSRGRLDWPPNVGPGSGEGARVFQFAGRVVAKGVVDIVRDADQGRRGSLESCEEIIEDRGNCGAGTRLMYRR